MSTYLKKVPTSINSLNKLTNEELRKKLSAKKVNGRGDPNLTRKGRIKLLQNFVMKNNPGVRNFGNVNITTNCGKRFKSISSFKRNGASFRLMMKERLLKPTSVITFYMNRVWGNYKYTLHTPTTHVDVRSSCDKM